MDALQEDRDFSQLPDATELWRRGASWSWSRAPPSFLERHFFLFETVWSRVKKTAGQILTSHDTPESWPFVLSKGEFSRLLIEIQLDLL